MPIGNITQDVSTIPAPPHRGVDVQTVFVTKQEDFQDHLADITIDELNTLKDQLNSRIGERNSTVTTMNGYADTASTGASTATTKAGEASTSASEALTSRNQAETFKNNANTSASTATTKASEASASALSASTSASTASTSASTATTKAGEASASASQALTSRNQAETFAQQAQASASSVDANNIVHRTEAETIAGVKTFSSNIVGNVTGNAGSATKLATAITINGVSFDGSANITVVDNTKLTKTNPSITGSVTEKVYALTGTEINPANGTIQYKTVSANTTFTETLTSGQSVLLRLIGASNYTITFPTITWVGAAAPVLTANCAIVLWKEQSTLYGSFVGTLV